MVAYEPGFPQVAYYSIHVNPHLHFSFTKRCNAALAKCTNPALTALKSQLRTTFCDNPSFDVAGNYSMTKCVTPNIDECINTATSPEWIAYYAEKTLASKNKRFSPTKNCTYFHYYVHVDSAKQKYVHILS